MNLNYEKIRQKYEHGGNHWTSYSDLFLVLSVVFLLLYVIANLRSGTMSIAQQSQLMQARKEADDMKKQIKAYEVLKDNYVKDGASQEEVQVYQELMGKLSLLEDQAKSERDNLYKQAKSAQDKEENLNRYQQLVKNIISANLVASSKLKKRDVIIAEQDKDIEGLNQNVEERENEINHNNDTISKMQSDLAAQIRKTEQIYQAKRQSKAAMDAEIARMKADTETRISELRNTNAQYVSQLDQAKSKIEEKNRETERLMSSLAQKETDNEKSMQDLEAAHRADVARAEKEYRAGLARERLSAKAALARERAHQAEIEAKNNAYQQKLQGLGNELAQTQQSMKNIEGKYQNSIASLNKTNDALAKNLAASIRKLNDQKILAEQIKNNFRKAGIDASVDPGTGDVTINFENEYFDTGQAMLKPAMKNVLEKSIPIYAQSLFKDPKIAGRIASVEIVGFASPTYKSKYVDPSSLSPETRAAVNYNMDLSYQRAKSIFEYTFDTKRMQFPHQQDLLPLVKVSGRSYLATQKLTGRNLTGLNDEFCKQFDCKKTQRVIIKFNLKDQ